MLGVLQEARLAPFDALLSIIVNEIARCGRPFVLVLDDSHTIHAKPIWAIISYLLEHMPPYLHLMLLTRTDPPLPLSRLRVRGQLTEIRAEQLRFTPEEIASFLNDVMGLELPGDAIAALDTRTEGWIASLQLAAISMQSGKDVYDFVSAFTGSHHYIMDYLVEEVLGRQAQTVGTFLLQSSILNRMCGSLCEAIVQTDQGESLDGQAMLEALDQANMFVIPLDRERRWYRYHHLFADVLNRRLEQADPRVLPELHGRASRWYEQNGLLFDAIRHAQLANDLDRSAQLLEENGCLLLLRGEATNLLRMIETVEPSSQTLPWIAIQKAWALCLTDQADQAEGALETAARLVAPLPVTDDRQTMLGTLTAARAHRANQRGETGRAADLARQALDYLPQSSDFSCSLRSVASSLLGDASWTEGKLAEAQHAYADSVFVSQAAGNAHVVITASSNLADALMGQGKLQHAARIYSEALQMVAMPDGSISPLAGRVYAGLARISYEWNRLDDAAKYARQAIELAGSWGSVEYQAIGHTVLARMAHASVAHDNVAHDNVAPVQGRAEAAREAMRAAEHLMREHRLTPWRSDCVMSDLARLWIAQGDLEKALYLIQENGVPLNDLPCEGGIPHRREPVYLILVRLHLAQNDCDAALALVQRLLQQLEGTSRTARVIEALVLLALACQAKRDMDRALAALRKVFSLTRPEGYVRTFLDEGEAMIRLLFQAKSPQTGTGYAAELLSAMGHVLGRATPPAQLLIEPLTSRELEVLALVEAGYSNQDIATRLVISLPTVKRHISNIYAKLGTSTRTQAVSRAKELNLLQ
jgi:LuxR family maltose regulon positive regulatory protein